MVQVVPGRFTAKMDDPFVVFVIGMSINNLLAVWKWLPTMRAMPPMLKELYQHPEKGFLGAEFFFHGRGPVTLQYWRSFEDLERFARNPDDPHLPAWQRFNSTGGKDGSVGIFHETFIVERGNYEERAENGTAAPNAWGERSGGSRCTCTDLGWGRWTAGTTISRATTSVTGGKTRRAVYPSPLRVGGRRLRQRHCLSWYASVPERP